MFTNKPIKELKVIKELCAIDTNRLGEFNKSIIGLKEDIASLERTYYTRQLACLQVKNKFDQLEKKTKDDESEVKKN